MIRLIVSLTTKGLNPKHYKKRKILSKYYSRSIEKILSWSQKEAVGTY